MPATPTGRPCWYELLTTDRLKAIDFYTAIFGWGTHDLSFLDHPYTSWMNGDTPIGGVMEMPDGVPADVPPHWLMYVSTPDLEGFVVKAKELGATILNRIDIAEVGLIAIVGDPAGGGCFAAYEPADQTPGHDQEARLGEVSWHELATDDLDVAWSFYSEIFGWSVTSQGDMGPPVGTYLMFGREGVELGGMYKRPPEVPVPSWLSYVRVQDAHGTAEKIVEHGGKVVQGPLEVPGDDWVAVCQDPQGAHFAIHSKAGG